MRFVGLMLVCCLVHPALAFAQPDSEEAGREIVRNSLAGWKGVTFRCAPSAKDDAFQDDICRDVRAEARLLAATGNIPFHDLSGQTVAQTSFDAAVNDFLVLEMQVRSTRGVDIRAVYMQIEASNYYSGAVEANAAPDKPEGQPRDGTLVYYSDYALGSGPPGPEFARNLTNTMSTKLKDFFAVLIESRNLKP